MTICEDILSILQQLYANPLFREAKAWCLSDNNYSNSPTRYFDSSILIDIYRGKEPYLLDVDFVTNNSGHVNFLNTLILDSNAAGSINLMFNGKHSNNEIELLVCSIANTHEKLKKKIFDINSTFYILESKVKNATKDHVLNNIKSILTVQHMDVFQFNRTGKIKLDLSQSWSLEKVHNTSCVEEISQKIYDSYTEKQVLSYGNSVRIIYSILIELTLIYKSNKNGDIFLSRFLDFLQNELGIFSLREIILGIAFIENIFNRLLPLNKTNPHKLLKEIYNTSWDISLLRAPELLLGEGTRALTHMGYVVTLEKELINYSKLFNFIFLFSAYNEFNTNFKISESLVGKYEKILAPYMSDKLLMERLFKSKDLSLENVNKLVEEKEEKLLQALS